MKNSKQVISLAFGAAALLIQSGMAATRPNIIIILSDDQGWGDVGFNGCTDIPTPNLDKLAASGISFQAGYATHPYSSPSRAGLLSGRYQQSFGHECNTPDVTDGDDNCNAGLPTNVKLIPELLKDNGYKTCAIGKWHLGDEKKFWPTSRGFDYWFGFSGGGLNYWGDTGKKPVITGVLRNGVPVDKSELTYLTDDFTRETIGFIKNNKSNPFFIYLAYNAPHAPIQATKKYLGLTNHIEDGARSAYGAMVAGMDEGIGKIIAQLKADKIYDNTMIFFYSDNGAHLNGGASSAPFRGHKGMLFEGGIREPFLVTWANGLPAGKRYQKPIIALDIYPTILAAANIKVPTDLKLDGVNLLPFLKDENKVNPRKNFFWRYSGGEGWAVRSGDLKLIKSGYKHEMLMFDLAKDPYEHTNIIGQMPAKAKEMEALYMEWNKNNIPPKWNDEHLPHVKMEEDARQSILNIASAGDKK